MELGPGVFGYGSVWNPLPSKMVPKYILSNEEIAKSLYDQLFFSCVTPKMEGLLSVNPAEALRWSKMIRKRTICNV